MTTLLLNFNDSYFADKIITDIVSCYINYAFYVPADVAEITFTTDADLPEIYEIEIRHDNSLIFVGTVDTQTTNLSAGVHTITLVARSLEGRLLDSDAPPQIYYSPSPYNIFNEHIRKYGIKAFSINDLPSVYELVIEPSTSEWEVAKSVFTSKENQMLFVDFDRLLKLRTVSPTVDYLVSNCSGDKNALRYRRGKIINKSSHLISHVYLINGETGVINSTFENTKAVEMGYNRARYREYNEDNLFRLRNYYAEKMKTQHLETTRYFFELDGFKNLRLGEGFFWRDPNYAYNYELIIIEKEFILDSSGIRTTITGIPRENCN